MHETPTETSVSVSIHLNTCNFSPAHAYTHAPTIHVQMCSSDTSGNEYMHILMCPGADWVQIGNRLPGRTVCAISKHLYTIAGTRTGAPLAPDMQRLLKAQKLQYRQDPLPDTSIDMPQYQKKDKIIRKGDTVVLSGMSKWNTEFNNKTCVVKLIVQECSEQDYKMVFMVELEEQRFFPAIIKANQRRERANKQTGYSRYGDQMQEHYFLARFGQITVQT